MMALLRNTLLIVLTGLLAFQVQAQEKSISKKYKKNTIVTLSKLMNDYYVFPEVAKKTEIHLLEKWENGDFDEVNELDVFADSLTASVQEINKDKHMRIRRNPVYEAKEDSPERMIEEKISQVRRSREWNAGFNKVEILEGNVGLIDLRNFAGMDQGKVIADQYMGLIKSTDAVIVDLRQNGGGSPAMVQYLCSYFFDEKIHLNSLYFREGNVTEEFWTLDSVGGKKMPDVPLYVLTSGKTFSGAEEFSYNMQTQGRATLVGETTGGGANPGGTIPINKELGVFIPGGRAINPITKTNWEGVGVIPEKKVVKEDALVEAHILAMEAAIQFRLDFEHNLKNKYASLNAVISSYSGEQGDLSLRQQLIDLQELGILNEDDINELGYANLAKKSKKKTAVEILKTNVFLFPNSANVYDSYGEALMSSDRFKEAAEAFGKAVEIAEDKEDRNLELFRKNLIAAKSKL